MIDLKQLRSHFDHDEQFFEKSRQLMLRLKAEIMDDLIVACEAGDGKKIIATAHNLQGMISNFFAEDLVTHLQQIEKSGRSGTRVDDVDLEKLRHLASAFEFEVSRVTMQD